MFGDADLPVFFNDFGEPIVWNGQSSIGILDTETTLYTHGAGLGELETSMLLLRFPYNSFSGVPQPGDTITVSGIPYTIRSQPEQKDQQILEFYLKEG